MPLGVRPSHACVRSGRQAGLRFAAVAALRPRISFVTRVRALATHRPRTVAALLVSGLLAVPALALALSGGLLGTELERGREAYRQGRYEQAVVHFDRALATDPNDAQGWFARGLAYQKLGQSDRRNYAHAAADFEGAWRLDPQGKSKACLGYCLQARGQSLEAALVYEEAIQSGYAPAELLNNLGAAEWALARLALAEQHLSAAIKLEPRLQAAYHHRALVYLQLARQQTAPDAALRRDKFLRAGIADANKALALGPPSGELFYDAAQLCGVAARTHPVWANPALDYLDQALRYGVKPKQLADKAWVALHKEPRFQALEKRSPVPHPAFKAVRILPPVKE